ncbi:hypothetical protein V6N13_037413 [Hibiscus sabdariffa]
MKKSAKPLEKGCATTPPISLVFCGKTRVLGSNVVLIARSNIRMTKGMSRQRQRVQPRQKSRLEFRSRQSVFCVTGLSLSPNNYLSCLYLIFLGEESVTFL